MSSMLFQERSLVEEAMVYGDIKATTIGGQESIQARKSVHIFNFLTVKVKLFCSFICV